MKWKAIAGLMLILIVISLSKLANDVSQVNADPKTIANQADKRYGEQAIIFEHRISTSELEGLKEKFGVPEEGRDYNLIIDGHGTGLRPPTEEAWMEIADETYSVEKILLAQLDQAPSSVDHTAKMWFPPIGDQDGEGSCTTWAVGYYTKTFQEAKEHEWNLTNAEWIGGYTGHPTPAYQDRIMSPDFIYHLVNEGVDEGSSFIDAVTLVCEVGASSWEKMPYDPVDHTSWPAEEAWREAPLYRGNSTGFESMSLNTDIDITSLKNWIAADHLAMIAVDATQYDNFPIGLDEWTLDNYVNPALNHANTIVGYDDDYTYQEEGESRSGAFKIVNSWGRGGWENIFDGCYWISYETMKQVVGHATFYRDRIDYDPKLMAIFNIDHSNRGECDVLIGMGNNSVPLASKSFSNLTNGGEQSFCPNNIVLDITDFQDGLLTVIDQPFFIQVYDQAPFPPHSGMHYWYSDGLPWSWFRLNQTFAIPVTGATLSFWTYYEIEEEWDYGYVEVHDLNTDEWYTLPGLNTVSTRPANQDNPSCPSEFEPFSYSVMKRWNALTGVCDPLYEEQMNLTQFAGHTIELYFTYWTDGYVLELGWYVDDVGIPEIGFFDDVESGSSGWTHNGWQIATPQSPNGTIFHFLIEHYDSYIAESLKAKSMSYDVPLNTTDLEYVCAFTIAGDLDGDCDVDPDDFEIFDGSYGTGISDPMYLAEADIDSDRDVDLDDLYILARNYGASL